MIYDVAIIGGGIVGLATALELLRERPRLALVLLEKEKAVAQHQSGHNSGVIHAGIYYTPGSLKAQLCREGAAATKAFCKEQGLAFEACGKLLVATSAAELQRMEALLNRAKQNGIEVERLDSGALARIEPNIRGLGALYVPSTGITGYHTIAAAMAKIIAAGGAELRLGAEVLAIHETPAFVEVSTYAQSVRARFLIVCGGLQSDRLARLAGLAINFRIVPFRGEFYALPKSRAGLIKHLIYPIPDPALPFVGIHLSKTIDGGIIAGPNAVLGLAREGYPKLSVNPRDIADYLAFPGFWRFARQHLRAGIAELRNSLSRRSYLAECQKYCPGLTLADFEPGMTGIRAQAVLSSGAMADDFLFAQTRRMLHVCNAPSPAATSAIPIGRLIAGKALARSAD